MKANDIKVSSGITSVRKMSSETEENMEERKEWKWAELIDLFWEKHIRFDPEEIKALAKGKWLKTEYFKKRSDGDLDEWLYGHFSYKDPEHLDKMY